MLHNNKNFISGLILLITIVFVLNGCISISGESVVVNSYKILKTTQIAYDNAMITASTLYKKGKISEDEKEEIIKIGNDFVKSYKILARVLEMYSNNLESPVTIEEATQNFIEINTKLMMYIREVSNR